MTNTSDVIDEFVSYIVTEFIEHDRHHQQQVDGLLGKTS